MEKTQFAKPYTRTEILEKRIAEMEEEILNLESQVLAGKGGLRKKIYNTDITQKREHWPTFAGLISNQFEHGGEKYLLDIQDPKEMTDLVCEISPGSTGADWVLQTISKYCGRYINFEREKDLLKIATYAFIMWIKMGHHLKETHDEDTERSSSRGLPEAGSKE